MIPDKDIQITTAGSDSDLLGILSLQQKNLPENISEHEQQSQGFVTVKHNLFILKKMHIAAKSIVAKSGQEVVGYCLAMTRAFAADIPVLSHMFQEIKKIDYRDVPLIGIDFIISGQVCVHKDYRGINLMDRMYQYYRNVHKGTYPLIITEIADHNPRSIKAHLRVGFEIIHTYTSGRNTAWHIVAWQW